MTTQLRHLPHVPTLADLCLRHLSLEEAHLTQCLDAALQVRAALFDKDGKALAEALRRQQLLADEADELRRARMAFRLEAARLTGTDEVALSLERLAERLPPEARHSLSQARLRLRAQADEVATLVRSNASVVSSCLAFFERLLGDLRGVNRTEARYGPTGAFRATGSDSLLEMRG